jgi:hypothetical protein
MMKYGTRFALATAVLFWEVPVSFSGVLIEQQVKDRDGFPSQVRLSCSEERLRTDHPESGLTTILDFGNDRIFLIDHRSKTFFAMKLSQWEKETAERLRRDNPAIRSGERVITLRKFGEKKRINGFQTEKVEVLADGERIEEHWVTKEISLGEFDRVMDRAAQGFSREFRSELREGQEIQKKLKPHGFSILINDYTLTHGLRAVDVLEVRKIERQDFKADTFLPPKGYERIIPQPDQK